jgi:hypothetical protein
MGKPAGTHQPLGYRARVRLRAATKHLHSKFHAVRLQAAKEIQAILHKKRGLQNRLREYLTQARNATVRKVTPSQLHKPLRVQKRAPQAQKRGQATPIRARMPKNGFTPLTDHPLTRAELRQRARAAKRGQPQQPRQPARKPDAMQQAQDAMRAAHAPQSPQPSRNGQQPATPKRVPPLPGHPEAVRKAAEDKPRWAGLRRRTGDASERTRAGRSRTRTTA